MAITTSSIDPRLVYARSILQTEAQALEAVADRLDQSFLQLIEILQNCPERIGITGVGKSADVGQKIAGTFNSMGTRSYTLDVTKAMHGDLGMVHPNDVVLFLSHSGESEELLRLLPMVRHQAGQLIAITGNPRSTLARSVDAAITYGPITESCPLALAPSTSTTIMIALGDAIAFVLAEQRRFTADDFARYHPAGSLGKRLARVDQFMRRPHDLRIASMNLSVRSVFAAMSPQGRRTGALILTDESGSLAGLFTDSDLARLFERRDDRALDRPIREVMTAHPITISPDARLMEAIERMRTLKISELPVIDEARKPIGLLDITDLIGLMPLDSAISTPAQRKLAS
ncbi:KpsF/GutQ family sugar-phosphate isomerase [Tuwongella immobilis]|uniref:KpsF/GutQ family sugar-phosphate isomerase n=1 Tax=Tuwongella immobilis TaxID=692036 RepID=A0A6C2YMZ2_9BACT|nr:KpsF/GutQ family sugar-phosphate isomerase [Tuwongella immobilis]VIP02435.1 family protein : KpsF/GutQ family protein OS=Planctomyces limnophilus (strain ATCC 43296 / DSM 3776 / IFAM 1008 / 290) GN=Plim_3740 PE=4 SV=1: SIS: CBS: CBS [Tuwongella immobilis]VTS01389.1 family protein : KpsF/GutQ family protein OS=Planctomyces limnophilus (strain ATCC 43296 / DSM 3776 / IFAM 1008 / 290) GN=Plim_3740 PE=4 SV=1: SIS: CBS: CBS [Tuwongella immobilis]